MFLHFLWWATTIYKIWSMRKQYLFHIKIGQKNKWQEQNIKKIKMFVRKNGILIREHVVLRINHCYRRLTYCKKIMVYDEKMRSLTLLLWCFADS